MNGNVLFNILVFLLTISIIAMLTNVKKECYTHEDYELNDGKSCSGDNCKFKNTCMYYKNYLKDE